MLHRAIWSSPGLWGEWIRSPKKKIFNFQLIGSSNSEPSPQLRKRARVIMSITVKSWPHWHPEQSSQWLQSGQDFTLHEKASQPRRKSGQEVQHPPWTGPIPQVWVSDAREERNYRPSQSSLPALSASTQTANIKKTNPLLPHQSWIFH